jgi:hypothetical protein
MCASLYLASVNLIWDPGRYGEFGIRIDSPNAVQDVVPGSPADRAGIRVGDRVERPTTPRQRFLLCEVPTCYITPWPFERINLTILRIGAPFTATLYARPLPALSPIARFLLGLKCLWLFVFVAISLILVLLRPNRMVWGFYLLAINLVIIFGPPPLVLSYVPGGWFFGSLLNDLIAPAGVAGFLSFCVRFPSNSAVGWRRLLESLAPYLYVVIAAWLTYEDAVIFVFEPRTTAAVYLTSGGFLAIFLTALAVTLFRYLDMRNPEREQLKWVAFALVCAAGAATRDALVNPQQLGGSWWSILATFMLGTVAVLITYVNARGLERHRLEWVIWGFVSALSATAVDFFWVNDNLHPAWFLGALELLYVGLPISVAYAVLRHRVIDARFMAGRAFSFGAIAAIVAVLVIGVVWLFSNRLPTSRLEAAIYAGSAILVGLFINATRQRIGKAVDFVLSPQWYRTQQQAASIADAVRHAASTSDLHAPLTEGIANTFSVASVALFQRIEDGGFIRVAAYGWQPGSMWHILPSDPLAQAAHKQTPIPLTIDALHCEDGEVPVGVGRPSVMLPLKFGRRVTAMLLCGSHENGARLARAEARLILKSCSDVGFVYGKSPARELAVGKM